MQQQTPIIIPEGTEITIPAREYFALINPALSSYPMESVKTMVQYYADKTKLPPAVQAMCELELLQKYTPEAVMVMDRAWAFVVQHMEQPEGNRAQRRAQGKKKDAVVKPLTAKKPAKNDSPAAAPTA